MLTILDTITHILGYFNINSRPLNQAYTIAALAGDGYLAYIAVLAFHNGWYARGAIYAAIFLILLYFIYLNIVYYFTKKKAKFDISPKVAKVLGTPEAAQVSTSHTGVGVASNGIFDPSQTLPAHITANADEEAFFQQLMAHLSQDQLLKELPVNQAGHRSIPYFDLAPTTNGQLQVVAGTNALTAKPIGVIDRIGFGDAAGLTADYQFALAELSIPEEKKDHPETVQLPELIIRVAYNKQPLSRTDRRTHDHH
ncbi:MAG: DUF6681 family protein [Schleiferilactobacillus perolens]|jgi:hypothetical protein|uniref:Uncharacterized protein n=3 Tax=Schleiferilactobacillus perolens TaxID=100468 RepID=A0A0R1N1F7_9LACO|nr:DUF6681 family protein [Schleiferilactobacillus perolens]KRL14093.1 hypothetical protein FD09_GL001253 [Schleiferilactobacillus perolens DSM 12744]MCI1890731.1 hypothetical protein [Schleiferilactobacillus harbinensis]MCI1912229.1 hypothetical protein [Schleiferilactobacillus harbinensis]